MDGYHAGQQAAFAMQRIHDETSCFLASKQASV